MEGSSQVPNKETNAQHPTPVRRLAGPEPPRVRAVGAGVVMTRREVREDFENRLTYGVGKF